MILRSSRDLEVIRCYPILLHAKLYHPRVNGLQVTDMRMVCLLGAVTPAWVTSTVPFLLVIGYIRYSGSFEILQAKVKCHISVGPARPVPRAFIKQYSARGGSINVPLVYIT